MLRSAFEAKELASLRFRESKILGKNKKSSQSTVLSLLEGFEALLETRHRYVNPLLCRPALNFPLESDGGKKVEKFGKEKERKRFGTEDWGDSQAFESIDIFHAISSLDINREETRVFLLIERKRN